LSSIITDSFTDSFGIVDIMTRRRRRGRTQLMVYKIYFDGFAASIIRAPPPEQSCCDPRHRADIFQFRSSNAASHYK